MKRISIVVLPAILLLLGCGKENGATFQASAIIEGTSVKVSAQTGGYLEQVYVNEGDEVQVGQTIAVVDTEKLGYQLDRAKAAVEQVAAERRIAEANLQRASDDYDYARTKYERFQSLYQTNAASEQVRDDLRASFNRARVALESAKQKLVAIASKKRGLLTQVKLLQRQIRDASVEAPVKGTVTTRYFRAGETIPTFAPLVEIIDLSEMWAKVYVSETYLPRIKVGQSAEVRVDGTDQALVGSVSWISPKAEFTPKNILTKESRTALVYAVKIVVANPDRVLKHGMPVSIILQPGS